MSDARLITVLKALSDSTRLDIVRSLSEKGCEVSCSEAGSCSELSQPAKSHHFKRLVEAGVLTSTKRGKERYYRLNRDALLRAGIDVNKL
ncbi:MAG: metalloregulator ArsR/SmtB family transcription factor [Candidatus Saccharibacteria bacterium]|nr:metalloregulator ArsR/SmtB family transcription factor [Candidatus Saccharibacteria bacterium]